MPSNTWTVDEVQAVVTAEKLAILGELAAVGRDIANIEAQFGARPEIQAARAWQQRLCMNLIASLIASLLASHTETEH